jgi:hypothetical protein
VGSTAVESVGIAIHDVGGSHLVYYLAGQAVAFASGCSVVMGVEFVVQV